MEVVGRKEAEQRSKFRETEGSLCNLADIRSSVSSTVFDSERHCTCKEIALIVEI